MWTSIFLQPAAQTIPSVPIPQTSPMTFALQKGCSSLQNFCSGRTHAFSAFHWLVFVLSYEILRIFFALKIPYCLQSLPRLGLYEKGTFLEKCHLLNVSYCKILESQDVLLCGPSEISRKFKGLGRQDSISWMMRWLDGVFQGQYLSINYVRHH